MTRRLMTLLVVSSVLFSGIKGASKAPDNIQDVAKQAFNDIHTAFAHALGNALDNSCEVVTDAVDSVEQLVQGAVQKIGTQITLHINNKGSHISVLSIGDRKDVPALALGGIKALTQTIKPEQAAFLYIKLYKEVCDDVLKAIEDEINYDAHPYSDSHLELAMTRLLRFRANSFDLNVMQQVLSEEIRQQCEMGMIEAAQKYMNRRHAEQSCTGDISDPFDKKQEASDYLYVTLESLVATLEQHYPIDRKALGLSVQTDDSQFCGYFGCYSWPDCRH